MEKKKKKSNLFIWLGLGAAAVVGFMVLGKSAKTPAQKTIEAMTTPGTPEYVAIVSWNAAHHPNKSFQDLIYTHIAHHINPANADAFIHKYL